MQSKSGDIRIPVGQPGPDRRQVQEYLDINHGPGVAHLALVTDNLIACLRGMKREGLGFPGAPAADYYEAVTQRVPQLAEDLTELTELGIQIEGDERGYLLEVFTPNVMGAFFLEIMQRNGGPSLGEENLRRFFQAQQNP
jgi:4-hydroxyphenylpyruvate dioxygenase